MFYVYMLRAFYVRFAYLYHVYVTHPLLSSYFHRNLQHAFAFVKDNVQIWFLETLYELYKFLFLVDADKMKIWANVKSCSNLAATNYQKSSYSYEMFIPEYRCRRWTVRDIPEFVLCAIFYGKCYFRNTLI